MTRFDCREVERALDGGPELELTVAERAGIEAHLAVCQACRDQALLWENLGAAMREVPLEHLEPMRERRLLTGRPAEPVRRGPRLSWVRISVAALAAGCVLLTVLVAFERALLPEVPGRPPVGGVAVAPLPIDDEHTWIAGATPGTALWVSSSSAVRALRNDTAAAVFQLDRGHVIAAVGPNADGYSFAVQTPSCRVVALGTVFSVQVGAHGEEVVRVAEGTVEVHDLGRGASVLLDEGTTLDVASGSTWPMSSREWARDLFSLATLPVRVSGREEPDDVAVDGATDGGGRGTVDTVSPVAPGSDLIAVLDASAPHPRSDGPVVGDLDVWVRQAQSCQRSGDFEGAREAYLHVISNGADRSQALTSQVALGQLDLDRLERADEALSLFDRYLELAPDGVLAEDARIGRVRSLAATSRPLAVIEAADEFVRNHPHGSLCAEVLRLRGDALSETGAESEALRDYREVIDRWPDTPQADLARQRLATSGEDP